MIKKIISSLINIKLMISLEDGIKYIGLTAIVFFLIKAFADGKLDDTQICILVLFIMVPVVLLFIQSSKKCKLDRQRRYIEGYQITDPPVTPSIYPGPPNMDAVLGTVNVPPPLPASATDPDIRDFKSIVPIDMEVYGELVDQENRAKNRIRTAYTNEMVFTETNPLNTVPLGTQLYGYTFLPPENWFRAYERPPVCINNTFGNNPMNGQYGMPNLIYPAERDNDTANLLQFDTTSNIPGPSLKSIEQLKNAQPV